MKGIKTYKNKARTIKKMAIETHILIMALNVNRLNAPTKRHRLAEWIKKTKLLSARNLLQISRHI